MQLVAISGGRLVRSADPPAGAAGRGSFSSGVAEWDALGPGGAFGRGVVHELLGEAEHGPPLAVAAALAAAACAADASGGAVAWVDPGGEVYPPALAAAGVDLGRLLIVRPGDDDDALWAAAACLRCPAVAATVLAARRVSRVQARRLQLAAERGGGVGLLLRPAGSATYAAATRWLVCPAPGDGLRQRWAVSLVHGHGGRVGEGVLLEVRRDDLDTNGTDPQGVPLRAADGVAGRAGEAGEGG